MYRRRKAVAAATELQGAAARGRFHTWVNQVSNSPNFDVAPPSWRLDAGWKPAVQLTAVHWTVSAVTDMLAQCGRGCVILPVNGLEK